MLATIDVGEHCGTGHRTVFVPPKSRGIDCAYSATVYFLKYRRVHDEMLRGHLLGEVEIFWASGPIQVLGASFVCIACTWWDSLSMAVRPQLTAMPGADQTCPSRWGRDHAGNDVRGKIHVKRRLRR